MKALHAFLAASAALGLFANCAPEAGPTSAAVEEPLVEARGQAPKLIQPGAQLVVLGVTDDDRAIYWDAGSVYATALKPGAPRQFVAAASQPPMTMVVGRVALIWATHPFVPALPTPSPLVIWTAKHGPREASASSLPPMQGRAQALAAVSPDGREVIFSTNVSADGATGDIVRASVDGSCATTLAAGVAVNPVGACEPHVGFSRNGPAHPEARAPGADGLDAEPEALEAEPAPLTSARRVALVKACPAGATAATLSKWAGDERVDLSTNVFANTLGWWQTDAEGRRLVTLLADRTPVLFDLEAGTSVVVEDTPATLAWINPDGAVFTMARTNPPSGELHRTTFDPAPRTEVVASFATGRVHVSNHLAQGLPYYNVSTVPPATDGRLAFGFTGFDPNTGLTDMLVVDTTKTNQTPIVLEAGHVGGLAFENATRDSSHLLYYRLDPATGGGTLVAATADGKKRDVSGAATAFLHFGLEGSKIAYSDNAGGDLSGFFGTTDIMTADVGAKTLTQTLIASQAYAQFFPTRSRRHMVYTSDADPSAQGLFVTRLR
jgi:hypothetical protein